ncbi:Protein CBG04822 [Caenorhabditis briggsae]|uniref:Protein CBG04822 n=1 Tax=Caenorhabditis briggsae TaxID=6238 RepID=A8WYJ9_CAEBR|nr:Protein CBG04822 [Caenorhabditis briggsae]CAP25457.2 Protein CBG04822 [Caenorhabditis briggsae]
MKPISQKRAGLQGIRGIAIISVVGFHFFPEYCPNGYLGVDQFFVLSGYLMCMLLQKSDPTHPCSLIVLFYSKRMKRIIPSYFLIIFLSLISLYAIFPETSWATNQNSGARALVFVSNQPKSLEDDYFQMLSVAIDIFTHTWSLSVEVQFYLMIPLIYLIGEKLSRRFQILYYILIDFRFFRKLLIFSSFLFITDYIIHECFCKDLAVSDWFLTFYDIELILASTSEDPEFEKLLMDSDDNDSVIKPNKKIDTFLNYFCIFLIFSLLILLFYPIVLDSRILRLIITIATGLLISISKADQRILSNPILTYFGDISYLFYLVHWPIYAYWKLATTKDQHTLLILLAASVFFSIFIHETVEKWYLKQCSTTIGVITLIFLILNVALINKEKLVYDQPMMEQLDHGNLTLDDAARLNHFWNVKDYLNLMVPTCRYESPYGPFGWCHHKTDGLSGTYKVMIIGNSWTANHANVFYQECGHIAKSILQGAASACEPLYPTRLSRACRSNFTNFEERIRQEKPDFVFMFTRFVTIGDPFPPNVTVSDNDTIYETMKEQMLKFIPNISRRLYILDAMPRPNVEYIEKIVPMLKEKVPMEQIDNFLVNQTLYQTARQRYAKIAKDCGPTCVLVDYDPIFWNSTSGTFRFYDEIGRSYLSTSTHLTPRGLEHIRNVWTDVCRRIL